MPIKKIKNQKSKVTKVTKAKPKKAILKTAAKPAKIAQVAQTAQAEVKKPELKKPQVAPEFKSELVKKYQEHKGDTGSTQVQIALLSDRITELVKHLKKHAQDFDSKRGLLILVGKRRRLLNYLKKTQLPQYDKMVVDLKLRK